MAANTTSTLARSAFTLAGPVITNTTPPPSESLARRVELNMRIHQAHVRDHIRRMQSLGRGLPSSTRARPRTTRAVAYTTHITTTTTTTTPPTAHIPIAAPTPSHPLTAILLNGLPTPPATPAPQLQPESEVVQEERPLLPTRRSRTRAARTAFQGTGAGLSFGLDVFGDDPVLSPRGAPFPGDSGNVNVNVSRTPRAPPPTWYFQAEAAQGENVAPPVELGHGEI